ncbi:nucleoside transporter-domain-containing protein [Talaromyces proteolyticus]|uniref:Nucleoside transporter-domain-containing protein n=1 Tax=Talaromyces proteolyticus TaxID=1131652 RepID=A0AAD4Q2Z0_9EURO|nr:nucleoside transporter-domain-containing protein [Talaromyces proteolyticus]KAH8704162.1 nucleoside transporter-domain-containing protein [Talaromyces proteolyticus]
MISSLLSRLLASRPAYEAVEDDESLADTEGQDVRDIPDSDDPPRNPFSWRIYAVFLLLGVTMLWAWNMFLAAEPYFRHRFQSSPWAAEHYEPSVLSVSTVTNLLCVLALAKLQKNASYPIRIALSLLVLAVVFLFLAFSTVFFRAISVGLYYIFVMTMVLGASFATGMNQNGVFAYVAGFGRPEYTQAIMVGQGIAGVLPSIVQIISNLPVPKTDGTDDSNGYTKSALGYFLVAVFISVLAFLAFVNLMNHTAGSEWFQRELRTESTHQPSFDGPNKSISLWKLFLQLKWLALAVFTCFAVTMVFPVFTAQIQSSHDPVTRSRLFDSEVFVPLAFLLWNLGDLLGRLSPLVPLFANSTKHPRALLIFALLRLLFIPLYMSCNVRGLGGSSIFANNDFLYLFIVQLGFGLTNGFLGSVCMMGAGQYVTVDEREAAGGFMTMMLVAGLATGSLLSFFVSSA